MANTKNNALIRGNIKKIDRIKKMYNNENMTIMQACAKEGISSTTYYRLSNMISKNEYRDVQKGGTVKIKSIKDVSNDDKNDKSKTKIDRKNAILRGSLQERIKAVNKYK